MLGKGKDRHQNMVTGKSEDSRKGRSDGRKGMANGEQGQVLVEGKAGAGRDG